MIALAAQSLLNGGFNGLLGGRQGATTVDTEAAIELAKKDSEIALLKAGKETDAKLVDVYTELRRQDKEQDAKIASLNTRVTTLEASAPLREQIVLGQVQSVANASTSGLATLQMQITSIQNTIGNLSKVVIPNTSVCPGWGDVTISPKAA